MSSSKAATSSRTDALESAGGRGRPGAATAVYNTRVGRLVGQEPDGSWRVDYPGNVLGPVRARAMASCIVELGLGGAGRDVVLTFDSGDPSLPIVLGLLAPAESPAPAVRVVRTGNKALQVSIDGGALVLRGHREVRIECGDASIAMHADGSIVLKGRRIVSRAAETNKIKGGSVAIN